MTFVGAVKHHRRMVKGREIDSSQVNVQPCFLLSNSDAFMQNLRADRWRINHSYYCDQ